MIKCDVKVCGVVSRSAIPLVNARGEKRMEMLVKVGVNTRDSDEKNFAEIVVVQPGEYDAQLAEIKEGERVDLRGEMTFSRKNEDLVLHLALEYYQRASELSWDDIDGTLYFDGRVRRECGVELRSARSGSSYHQFSAFAVEKRPDGNKPDYIWVRFFMFQHPESWLQAGSRVKVVGSLGIHYHKNWQGKEVLNLTCRVDEVEKGGE